MQHAGRGQERVQQLQSAHSTTGTERACPRDLRGYMLLFLKDASLQISQDGLPSEAMGRAAGHDSGESYMFVDEHHQCRVMNVLMLQHRCGNGEIR